MTFPSKQDWLFSVKTFIAAIMALYIALYFQLPRPYWAMATVYIVSNPFVGATRSKALYRALGTMLGASAAVFFVPPLVETPFLLTVAVASWSGCLLFLSLTDRTARSYVFLLAGYTMPLIALPTVDNPGSVFDVAVSRSEEIILGIICASVINSSLFPSRLGVALGARTAAWFSDAASYAKEILGGRIVGKDLTAARQRLAASVNGLELLLSQLAYDHARPDVMRHAQALRGRMSLLLPTASALGDPLAALRAHGSLTPEIEQVLKDVVEWVGNPDSGTVDAQADALRARLDALEPPHIFPPASTALPLAAADADAVDQAEAQGQTENADTATSTSSAETAGTTAQKNADQMIGSAPYVDPRWDNALLSSLLWRLRIMVDLWQDCRSLREMIRTEAPAKSWIPRLRHWRLGGVARHFDVTMMFVSVLPAVVTTILASVIWILTGWADGAGAVILVAVSCSFFAALDQPAPLIFSFFHATIISTILAGIYLFGVLPSVHDFPMLVILFAAPFIIIGSFIPQPKYTLITMLVSVLTATNISIQGTYSADFTTFVNGNTASSAGLLFAFICMRIARPFGAEVAIGRLTRSGWADVVLAASPHAIAAQNDMAARMLDRLMQLLPRLNASDINTYPSADSFRDLRAGLNALDLQHIRRSLDEESRLPIDRVLNGVREHFQRCIVHRERVTPSPELAAHIDNALEQDAGSRGAVHALVGLRLSIFPAPKTLSAPSTT